MTNKQAAVAFLESVIAGKIREGYAKFVAPQAIHHNIHFPGDRRSLLEAMEQSHVQFPDKRLAVKQVLEEGDRVMVFSHVTIREGELEMGIIHLFRFSQGQIVELWDVGQQVPEDSPNENGMF